MRVQFGSAAAILVACTFASSAGHGATGGQQSSSELLSKSGSETEEELFDPRNVGKHIKVKPGETKSNGDVTVSNHSSKKRANAQIRPPTQVDPPREDQVSDSNVETLTHFMGSIKGIDAGDTVEIGRRNSDVTVSGTGGTIIVDENSVVTVTNKSVPPNGARIKIKKIGGVGADYVPPGSTLIVNTNPDHE